MTDFEQQIGPFRLYSEIGRTPISNQYRAIDTRSEQAVVLYLLNPEAAQQTETVEQFLTLGVLAMRLRHPNIVPVVDTGETQGYVYIASQWIRGQSLGEQLRHTGRTMDTTMAAYIGKTVATALDYAHSQGFIHGHLTLDQIYVTEENTLVLDGFAEAVRVDRVAAAQDGEADATVNPLIFISPFLAPEQAQSGQPFDHRVDIYSLGAVLYTIILGHPPFVAEDPNDLLNQIIEKEPALPEMINPALPAALVYVLKAVLAKDPAKRYASAGELANAFLQGSQWVLPAPAQAKARIYKRRGFAALPFFLLFAVILSLVLISGIGMGWFGERFAFLPSGTVQGVVTQLRNWVQPQSDVAVELTANPMDLTPVIITLTPPPPTAEENAVALAGVAASQALSNTETMAADEGTAPTATANLIPTPLLTRTATLMPNTVVLTTTDTTIETTTATATATTTATDQDAASIAATGTPTPSLVTTATQRQTPPPASVVATATVQSALAIDPFGLLTAAVDTGQIVINGAAAPGARIQLQINGKASGSTTSKSSGTWSVIVPIEQPGVYTVTAQVVDDNGTVLEATQHTITAATSAPLPTTIVTPTATVSATVTVGVTRTLSATATSTSQPTATVTPTTQPVIPPTNTLLSTATPTPTAQPTVTNTVLPTATSTPPPSATYTSTAAPTATVTNTAAPTATATNTAVPTATASNTPRPTATVTNTTVPTATATNTPRPTATVTNTTVPTATVTNTPRPTATVTNTVVPTATATNTPRPTATVTNTVVPTATATNTPRPTATVTNTAVPTATATNTPRPTVTVTNTVVPTATVTNTPRPTATVTNTAVPTATVTNTPRPTATVTNTAAPTATSTNTSRPTATVTNTAAPTATASNTPKPTATATRTPKPTATATNTMVPTVTATNTLAPTATPTDTPLPTATNTPLPPPTSTRPPTATNTPLPTATPTPVVGTIEPIAPSNGESGSGQRTFSWSANFTPGEGYAFELVFWRPGQNPMGQGFGMASPTTNLSVNLDLESLDERLGNLFDLGEYNWGVLLVRTTPTYERIKYLGGGRSFIYARSGGSGSDGQSSGE